MSFKQEPERLSRTARRTLILNLKKACSTLQSRMSLCYIRSRLLSMYHLDELKCDRQNQMVNIMITAPNQKACVYAKHTLAGVNRRIWTDNQFEDCHNAEMLGMVYPFQLTQVESPCRVQNGRS